MRWVRFAVLLLGVAVLQASGLLDVIGVTALNVKPDLLLILVAFFSIYCDTTDGIITSFVIGLAADVVTGQPFGARMISYGVAGTALAYLRRVIAIRQIPYQAAAVFLTCLAAGGLVWLLTILTRRATIQNTFIFLLGTAVYSAITGPFLFLPVNLWMRMKAPSRRGRHRPG
jgi:rod shape-determining protein MreD